MRLPLASAMVLIEGTAYQKNGAWLKPPKNTLAFSPATIADRTLVGAATPICTDPATTARVRSEPPRKASTFTLRPSAL